MNAKDGRSELPLDPSWQDTDAYVESLLNFATTSTIFQNLCGGVHVLDFLTRMPDLYDSVLPQEWRDWFERIDVHDLLHILLRVRTEDLLMGSELHGGEGQVLPRPPQSLREYIHRVRIHCLGRSFIRPPRRCDASTQASSDNQDPPMARHVSVGMKPKKIHEVSNFASFVSDLAADIHSKGDQSPTQPKHNEPVQSLKLVDFGSGQNYLGRTLASPPYNQHIIAIERKHHNVDGARGLDVHAKLAKKEKIMRNKKEYKRRLADMASGRSSGIPTPPTSDQDLDVEVTVSPEVLSKLSLEPTSTSVTPTVVDNTTKGSMTHINHEITSGELESIIYPATSTDTPTSPEPHSPLMTISLHSCGNLTHHALRSIHNPSVRCVAAIGCCYNLLTERLGPATYKHPQLHRSLHPRLVATSTAYDPCGFPMSRRLEEYSFTTTTTTTTTTAADEDVKTAHSINDIGTGAIRDQQPQQAQGVRMNITARMMAVQAPGNWGREDSEMFFTRHFYRALLQKILLDCGVVKQAAAGGNGVDGNSLSFISSSSASSGSTDDKNGGEGGSDGTPLIVGSLKKSAFDSFEAYVRAAVGKLISQDEEDAEREDDATAAGAVADAVTSREVNPPRRSSIRAKTAHLFASPRLIQDYETQFGHRRKHLAIMWSLMAFSAGVVESLIAVDRWLWLKEQDCVERAWVQTVFDYSVSPRNLCVVGVKKAGW